MKLCLILASCIAVAAHADWKSDALRWNDLLHPETASWTPLYAMKKANMSDFSRASLSASYMKYGNNAKDEASCDNFERLMQKQNDFHLFDFNGDGSDDLLYSGNCLCSEGHCTYLWLKKDTKWAFHPVARTQVLLMRAKGDAKMSYSGLATGCCDSPQDEYVLLNENFRSTTITKNLKLPQSGWKVKHAFKSKGELTLRHSPEALDKYELGESEHQNMAVFGNVLAKFVPGAHGKVLGETKGKDGKVWLLLEMHPSADILRSYDYARKIFHAGWAPASSVQLSK